MSNLDLWEKVETTDLSATKGYKGAGGFQGTSINAISMVKKATEVFGVIGIGWGYSIAEERFDEGGPIHKKSEETNSDITIGKNVVHTIKLNLWVRLDGKKAEVECYGHTPFIYANKYGVQTDTEAPKKSLTDAIKKGLSMFGFSADIFLGLHDDHEYIRSLQDRQELEKSDNAAETALKQRQEYDEWKETTTRVISDSVSMNELEGLFVAAIRKVKRMDDKEFEKEVTRLKDKRKAELSKK